MKKMPCYYDVSVVINRTRQYSLTRHSLSVCCGLAHACKRDTDGLLKDSDPQEFECDRIQRESILL